MAKDKQIGSLPSADDFWKAIDNDPSKEFMSTCVIEKIRNGNPKTDVERIEFIAQLKLLVEMLDSPRNVYKSILLSKIEQEEREDLESAL
jgi:hypothetical protein